MNPSEFQLFASAPNALSKVVRVAGIDLGTTNSTVAEVSFVLGQAERAKARCVEIVQDTLEGAYTSAVVPSIVVVHDGRTWIGEGAKRLRAKAANLGLERGRTLFFECKNDIGLRRTYPSDVDGYGCASDIAGHLLRFLAQGARADEIESFDRVVVTVPASFQVAQREDTRRAVKRAGLDALGGDLLDEPVAALLDYLVTVGASEMGDLSSPKTLVVFDFGGGTCDVAILKIGVGIGPAVGLGLMPVAVSRYHRLGGGDIDAAIVHDVLIPQICQQNALEPRDLTYEERKAILEPALLGIAEALKTGLSTEIRRMEGFGKYEKADKTTVLKKQPGYFEFELPSRTVTLQSPVLTAARFEELLEPFLDRDLLYARETEYRLTLSIFAPIQDALDRAGIDATDIDLCLLVGGSSLIPQVASAVKRHFPSAGVLKYPDLSSVQTAVARGAAYHALSLKLSGRPPFEVAAYEAISIRTATGLVTLVQKEERLPVPVGGGFKVDRSLVVPETVLVGSCTLRVELVAGSGPNERALLTRLWEIPGPVTRGDSLELRYRFDVDQVMELELRLAERPEDEPFRQEIDNPLTHVVNPLATRLRADELEEQLRAGEVAKPAIVETLAELGDLHVELNQREKALAFLRRAMAEKGRPDAGILNKMGITYGEMGDVKNQEKCYEAAASASPWPGPLFNLALARRRRSDFAGAVSALDRALLRERTGPFLVLRSFLAKDMGHDDQAARLLSEALAAFAAPGSLDDWELGWFRSGADRACRQDLVSAAQAELKRRSGATPNTVPEGLLPEVTSAIMESRS